MLDQVHYIIPYRESTPERRNALAFVLSWLEQHLPEVAILIVEQDEVPRLSIPLPARCETLFLYNKGLFNKGWALNHAARYSDKEVLVFADADVFLERENYLSCFEACQEFETVSPHKDKATNVKVSEDKTLEFQTLEQRHIYVYAAMFFVIQRKALLSIGGWDERFEGWGGEDDVISHLIVNSLTSKVFNQTLYHIDHERLQVDGREQPRYLFNQNLAEEIGTYQGIALKKYKQRLLQQALGQASKYQEPTMPEVKPLHFVLAVTTYNRINYLQEFFKTYLATRRKDVSWEIIIADDGSDDGTQAYIQSLEIPNTPITVIQNNRTDITQQTNTILKKLSQRSFDLCFKCDDDVIFLKAGWDTLYWEAIQRTGYEHFSYYNLKWWPDLDLDIPIKKGNLLCYSTEVHQGAFFTITPNILKEVGYFDRFNLGFRGYEHNDYTVRCCRAGFNCLETPFDLNHSNDYLDLQAKDGYVRALSTEMVYQFNTPKVRIWKRSFLSKNRLYIPHHEDELSLVDLEKIKKSEKEKRETNHKLADEKYYPERGFWGWFGTMMKRTYNFFLRRHWLWFPRMVKKIGLFFIKAGEDLRNIDQ